MQQIKAIFLFSIILFCVGCTTQKEMKEEIKIINQYFYEYSGIKEKQSYIIQNTDDWQHIHNRIYEGITTVPELKSIDFSKNSVVVISFGEKSTGGFNVVAENYKKVKSELFFQLKSPKLDPMSPVTMAFTQPVLVITIPKTTANEVVYEIIN